MMPHGSKRALHIGSDAEYFDFLRKEGRRGEWTGPADLSADVRYLWDEDFSNT